jgi:DNA topoisomerase IA
MCNCNKTKENNLKNKNIVCFCSNIGSALRYAAALGGIPVAGGTIDFGALPGRYGEAKGAHLARGYIKTLHEGQGYVFTWGGGASGTLMLESDYNPAARIMGSPPLPFIPPRYCIKPSEPNGSGQWDTVYRLFRSDRTRIIYSATDYDSGGELSFSHAYELSGTACPYRRVRITEITEGGIRRAFAGTIHARDNEPRALAARAGEIADFLVGTNMTTYHARKRGGGEPLRYGRTLTPALSLFCERAREIEAATGPLFTVKGIFTTDEGAAYEGLADGIGPFRTEGDAQGYIDACLTERGGFIAGGGASRFTERPPAPYDTATLCADAYKAMGYHPSETLNKHLKNLYRPPGGEPGYITYPRTGSRLLPAEMEGADFAARVGALRAIPEIAHLVTGRGAGGMYFGSGDMVGSGAVAITAQPPDRGRMAPGMFRVYALVAQRILALTYPPAELAEWSVETLASGHGFTTRGCDTLSKGYLKILPRQAAAQTCKFGNLRAGAKVSASYEPCELPSSAPAPYTEAGILKALAPCAGADRTASHIALIKRMVAEGYIREGGEGATTTLSIADRGARAIELLLADELKSPLLMAEWERALSEIENLPVGTPAVKARQKAAEFVAAVEGKVRKWCR